MISNLMNFLPEQLLFFHMFSFFSSPVTRILPRRSLAIKLGIESGCIWHRVTHPATDILTSLVTYVLPFRVVLSIVFLGSSSFSILMDGSSVSPYAIASLSLLNMCRFCCESIPVCVWYTSPLPLSHLKIKHRFLITWWVNMRIIVKLILFCLPILK